MGSREKQFTVLAMVFGRFLFRVMVEGLGQTINPVSCLRTLDSEGAAGAVHAKAPYLYPAIPGLPSTPFSVTPVPSRS